MQGWHLLNLWSQPWPRGTSSRLCQQGPSPSPSSVRGLSSHPLGSGSELQASGPETIKVSSVGSFIAVVTDTPHHCPAAATTTVLYASQLLRISPGAWPQSGCAVTVSRPSRRFTCPLLAGRGKQVSERQLSFLLHRPEAGPSGPGSAWPVPAGGTTSWERAV